MTGQHEPDKLCPHLRDEAVPDDAIVVVRGGPSSLANLRTYALRTSDAFELDEPSAPRSVGLLCARLHRADIARRSPSAFASYRVVNLPRVGQLRAAGYDLLPSFRRPHFTILIDALDALPRLLGAFGPAEPNPYHGRKGTEVAVVTVDITCDLMDEDESGYVWTFVREARDPSVIEPGAIVVVGDEDAPAVAEVVEIADRSAGTVVHLRLLPGAIEDYEALVRRAITPA